MVGQETTTLWGVVNSPCTSLHSPRLYAPCWLYFYCFLDGHCQEVLSSLDIVSVSHVRFSGQSDLCREHLKTVCCAITYTEKARVRAHTVLAKPEQARQKGVIFLNTPFIQRCMFPRQWQSDVAHSCARLLFSLPPLVIPHSPRWDQEQNSFLPNVDVLLAPETNKYTDKKKKRKSKFSAFLSHQHARDEPTVDAMQN